MKKLTFLGAIVWICTFFSCTQEQFIAAETDYTFSEKSSDPTPISYSPTELIIQYKEGTTEAQKQILRTKHEISAGAYEICDRCPGKFLELWNLSELGIDPEDKKRSLTKGGGGAEEIILDVEREFSYVKEASYQAPSVSFTQVKDFHKRIVSFSGSLVSIAIIDSGIDPFRPSVFGSDPFLMDSSDSDVPQLHSGWDFVRHDAVPEEESTKIHGTKVTSVLFKSLQTQKIPFQILPVKVLDGDLKGSYFDILCGLQFALQKVDIVNISLGWYGNNVPQANSIFHNIAEMYESTKLIITSSGNQGRNTDEFYHYPSSLGNPNLLAVAASNEMNNEAAVYTNYGPVSVDFYARGNTYFPMPDQTVRPISGTSFAAPIVTAAAAAFSYHNMNAGLISPTDIIYYLESSGTKINFSRPVFYQTLIN